MEKYDYVPGFCTHLHYNGLWPCRFEESPEGYRKSEMVCKCGDGNCKNNCPVFENTDEYFPQDKEWMLKDEL